MCGRYAQTRAADAIERDLIVDQVLGEHRTPSPEITPSWNVAPTHEVPVVLERVEDDRPRRRLRTARWGLVPSWAKDVSIGSRMINARSETLLEKPAFRKAAARRRALVPMDGYYEWQAHEHGPKTPFFLHADAPLAAAGLYELWRDPARADDDPARWLWTVTIVTRPATDALGHIHDRCPVLLPPDAWDDWLDPAITAADEVGAMLVHLPEPHLVPREVSRAVGDVANDGPGLVEPVG
jgi:putative SOS response-associated peptidase YedK